MSASGRKAFLKYVGKRRWRKVKRSSNSKEKNYLIYVGHRKWKKVKDTQSKTIS